MHDRDLAIVLSGGGMNGLLLELGFLGRLREDPLWERVGWVYGTSAGALTGVMAAIDRLDALERFALALSPDETFRPNRLWQLPLTGLHDYALPETISARLAPIDELARGEPIVIVGNSLGGAVAVRYAIRRPAAVTGLILLSPAGAASSDADWQATLRAYQAALRSRNAKGALVASLPENLSEAQAADLMARGIAPLQGIDDALAAAAKRRGPLLIEAAMAPMALPPKAP